MMVRPPEPEPGPTVPDPEPVPVPLPVPDPLPVPVPVPVVVPVFGELVVVPDACKHRGGPLSKGTVCPRTGAITCPWHDLVNTARELGARALPQERVGDEILFEAPPAPGAR